jgi:hypothetical protein
MTIKVVVHYEQEYWGKTLTDTYTRLLDSMDEISSIYEALYEDPCVKHVDVKIIPEAPKEREK